MKEERWGRVYVGPRIHVSFIQMLFQASRDVEIDTNRQWTVVEEKIEAPRPRFRQRVKDAWAVLWSKEVAAVDFSAPSDPECSVSLYKSPRSDMGPFLSDYPSPVPAYFGAERWTNHCPVDAKATHDH